MSIESAKAHPLRRVGFLGSSSLLHLTAALLLLVNLLRPVHDSDLLWQLKVGELTLAAGWPPAYEPFLADKLKEPYVPIYWLGQVVFAAVRRLGGWPLLHVVDGLLWVGGLCLAGAAARRNGAAMWAVCAALVLANWTAYSSVSTRPQTFAMFGFGALIAVVRRQPTGWRTVAAITGLLVLWQNLHPSVAVGALYLGAVAAVGWGRWWRGQARPPWALTAATVLSPLTLFATPAGAALLRVGAYNADVSRWLEINEWLSLWELHARGDWRLEAVGGLLIFAGLLAWRGRRVAAEDVVPAVLFAALAIASYRFAMFFAVAAVPVWACGFSPQAGQTAGLSPTARRWWLVALGWGLAVAVPTAVRPSHLADYVPFAAVERLKAEGVRGVLYTHAVWAGVLLDAAHPQWVVTYDGRYYLRSKDEWDAYHAAARGEVPVDELDRRWHPVAFVLKAGFEEGLIAQLRAHPGWRELPPDKECVLFVRASPGEGR